MIEKFDKAEITENSLSVRVRLYDEFTRNGETKLIQVDSEGNPTANGHRRAIGLGDYAEDPSKPTSAEKKKFEDAVKGQLSHFLPPGQQIAAIQRVRDERQATAKQLANMTADRDRLFAEVQRLDAQLAQLQVETTP